MDLIRNNTNPSFLKVLDWKSSSSKIISPEIEKIAQSNSFGSSHAKNAIAWISGETEPEILVYPETVQKRLKTEENAGTDNEIQLIPNPANKEVTLHYNFGKNGKREISVFNSSGSIIYESIISEPNGKKKINTSEWANGMYLFKIIDQNKTEVVKKLLISK